MCEFWYKCRHDRRSDCSKCVYNFEYMQKITDEENNIIDEDARFYIP
jgi:hypothetical protein